MSSVVAIRHVAFEDLGLLGPLLEARGHSVRYLEAPLGELATVDPLEPALVVVLGGPIGANDEADYPFLREELALVEARLRSERPVLGICLGAQVMARALGARVYPGPRKEIGWAPLALSEAGRASCLGELAGRDADGATTVPVLHWHGDTFDLPDGAVHLASTQACANQAFTWGPAALALQFHLETVGKSLESWLVGHTLEISGTAGVTVRGLRADTERCTPDLEPRSLRAFERWLARVGLS